MRTAFAVSTALHATLLATLFVSFGSIEPPSSSQPVGALPVELVSLSEESTLITGEVDASVPVEEAAPEAVEAEAPPEPEEAPGANDQQADTIATDEDAIVSREESASPLEEAAQGPQAEDGETAEVAEASEAAPEEAEAEPVPDAPAPEAARVPETVVPNRKPTPPRPTRTAALQRVEREAFDADRVSDLINRVPNSGGGSGAAAAGAGIPTIDAAGELTLDEQDYLRAKMNGCWVMPVGLRGAPEDVIASIRIYLRPDGMVDRVEVPNPRPNAIFEVAANAARRAAFTCQPYELPPQRYAEWEYIGFTFDPTNMF